MSLLPNIELLKHIKRGAELEANASCDGLFVRPGRECCSPRTGQKFPHKETNWTKWQKTGQALKSGLQLGQRFGDSQQRELAGKAQHKPWEREGCADGIKTLCCGGIHEHPRGSH